MGFLPDEVRSSGDSPTAVIAAPASPYRFSFGYWNDNFVFEDILGKDVADGKDDYVTASFWLQVSRETTGRRWFADVYHNILTNKPMNYRIDLLTLRISIERTFRYGMFQAGTGVISSGNYGGRSVQNAYHRLMGYRRVGIPYRGKEKTAPILFLRFEAPLLKTKPGGVSWYAANSYRANVGPSNIRAGLDYGLACLPVGTSWLFGFQTRVGVIKYYQTGTYLSPLFDRGVTWGALVSLGRIGRGSASLWITSNQYGKEQPHFGVSYSFGGSGRKTCGLSDVTFP